MGGLNGWRVYAAVLLCATTAIVLPAQTLTTLHSFDLTDGANPPPAALVQATDGNLYGTTYRGGASNSCFLGCGTVFKITPSGTLTTLHSFDLTDGANPLAAVIQATNGNFYGTTYSGGANNAGTVFKITPSGTLTTLFSFCSQGGCTDGRGPYAALVQATNGNLYGTTLYGGAKDYGTFFKITPSGTLTTLYSFCSQSGCTDGAKPVAGLVQATDGDFYGTTNGGGAGNGTVFKITPSGTLTTLHIFAGYPTDGGNPYAALVQGTDANFYGTTNGGGTNNGGTVFKITPSGTLTTLYSFCSKSGCTDGQTSEVGLVQATDGNFYGTAYYGGTVNRGTVFEITPSGTLTTLYNFCSQSGCTDGAYPWAALLQDTNGSFYGTTVGGGAFGGICPHLNCGTVFSLSVGLGPFVETQPASGKVGATIKVLGTNLTSATNVTFNGTAAVFKVASSSFITTTVPAGATTGKVKVVTPHGTLLSNVPFRVRP